VDEVGACMAFRDKYFIDLILTFFQIFLLASLGSKEDKAKTWVRVAGILWKPCVLGGRLNTLPFQLPIGITSSCYATTPCRRFRPEPLPIPQSTLALQDPAAVRFAEATAPSCQLDSVLQSVCARKFVTRLAVLILFSVLALFSLLDLCRCACECVVSSDCLRLHLCDDYD
jgi:hypothetical protein